MNHKGLPQFGSVAARPFNVTAVSGDVGAPWTLVALVRYGARFGQGERSIEWTIHIGDDIEQDVRTFTIVPPHEYAEMDGEDRQDKYTNHFQLRAWGLVGVESAQKDITARLDAMALLFDMRMTFSH